MFVCYNNFGDIMNQLFFLGNDSGFGNDNTSAYIIKNNKLLLIDCGTDVFYKLLNKDRTNNFLKSKDEISVIITHLHNDHVGSLSQLILYCYFVLNKKITIHSKCKHLKTWLDISGTPSNSYTIEDNKNIAFIKTTHTKYLDSYGVNIKINNKNIVYTSDVNSIEPFYEYLQPKTDFYVDASYNYSPAHLSLKNNLEKLNKLTELGVNVYLMHIDDINKVKQLIKKTNIHICDEYRLNKKDIINILEYYNFEKEKYLVIGGATMVLYGFKEHTRDIDISVSIDLYEKLMNSYKCKFEKINNLGKEVWFLDETINFGQSFFSKDRNYIENIPVQTKKNLIKLKTFLNREKDNDDIIKIKNLNNNLF